MVSQKKRIWGWYFFDWASQPYNTLLLTFIFGPYFAEVASGYYLGVGLDAEAAKAEAQAYWGYGLTLCSLVIFFLAPILGAVADSTGTGITGGSGVGKPGKKLLPTEMICPSPATLMLSVALATSRSLYVCWR